MNAPDLQPSTPRPTLTDVQTLRESARRHVEDGAVTEHYSADRVKVLQLLNEALATEMICVLRYRQNYFAARGLKAKVAAAEFLEHANEELAHADSLCERIVQLGGNPDLDPQTLTARSHAEYRIGATLQEMIRENLVAERIAIDSYREMAQYVGEDDPTTRGLLESILATEEEHADDLKQLLEDAAGSTNV
ncbi:MAG TPA: ferritin-like domain-containing protein [Usitatibacter sp.]|nr:ferritin-like domain-containing protein [Usitatibacter sp.]